MAGTRSRTRRILYFVGVLAACVLLVASRVGCRRLPAFRPDDHPRPRGAYHIHTKESHDSSLELDDLISVARRAGLNFLVVTNHNSQLEAPLEVDGLTVLSYAELTTPAGHLVQLGSPFVPSPEDRDRLPPPELMQLLRQHGGTPFIAHPTNVKGPWTGPLEGAEGIEIANTSSSAWRRGGRGYLGLLPALLALKFRPRLAMAQVYDRDQGALQRWDTEADPQFVGICTGDTHGRIDVESNLIMWEVVLEEDLPEEMAQRPAAILEALESGRFHCEAGLLGHPRFSFFGRGPAGPITVGESVRASEFEEIVLLGPEMVQGVPATLVLLRDGQEIRITTDEELRYADPAPGTYRAEVRVGIPEILLGERQVPVLYSNQLGVLPDR